MRHKTDRKFLSEYLEHLDFVSSADEKMEELMEDLLDMKFESFSLDKYEIIFSVKSLSQGEDVKQFLSNEKVPYDCSNACFQVEIIYLLECLKRLDSKELIQTTLMQDEISSEEAIINRLDRLEAMMEKIIDKECCDNRDCFSCW